MWVSLKDEGIETPEEPAPVVQPGKKRSYRRYKTKK